MGLMGRYAAATRSTLTMAGSRYADVEPGKDSAQQQLINGSLDGRSRLAPCVSVCSSADRTVRSEKNINLALVLAIALVLSSKKLQRHTGIAAEDWRKELIQQAIARLNSWSEQKIQKFIAKNFNWTASN